MEMSPLLENANAILPPDPPEIPNSHWQPPAVSHSSSGSKTSVLTPSVVAVIALLGAAFLLVSYYRILARYCTAWQYFWGLRWQRQSVDIGNNNDDDVDFEQAWVVLTHGLDEILIRKIPMFIYKKGEGVTESTECVVCLTEFQEEDKLRLLPKCNHAFHLPCVDMWLQTHSTCPLCRAIIFRDLSVSQPQGLISDLGDEEILVTESDIFIAEEQVRVSTSPSSEPAALAANMVTSTTNEDVHKEIARKLVVENPHMTGSVIKNAPFPSTGESAPQECRQDFSKRTFAYKRFPFSLLRRSNSTGSYLSTLPDAISGMKGNLSNNAVTGSDMSSFSPEFKSCLPSLGRQRSLSFCSSCDRGSSSNTSVPWLARVTASHDVEQHNVIIGFYDSFSQGKLTTKTSFMSNSHSSQRVYPYESKNRQLFATEADVS